MSDFLKNHGRNQDKMRSPSIGISESFDGISRNHFSELTDSELYQKCKEYGNNARLWMRKFAGLLPEVYKRKLYKRRGYVSIHEFAAKLAGMNRDTVNRILNLEQKLKDKPILLSQFESGEQPWSKLEIVASVATPETDKNFSEKIKLLTKPALQEFVKQNRPSNMVKTFAGEALPSQKIIVPMPLDPTIKSQLELLKLKLEKERNISLSWNDVMKELLKGYGKSENEKQNFKQQKKAARIIQICPKCVKQKADLQEIENPSRHIPAAVKSIVEMRSQGICEYPLCLRPAVTFHHTRRFSLEPNHDPSGVRHLCKIHHDIVHASLIKNEEEAPAKWQLRKSPERGSGKFLVDKRAANFKFASREK